VPWGLRAAIVLVAACSAAGCYNYNPLTTPSPDTGSYLAVTLNDAGSARLARYLGPDVFLVRGRYVGQADSALLLSVSSVETKRGEEMSWQGETVTLPRDAIAALDVRRLAKGRSLLLAGVGAGGVIATTLAFNLLGSGTPLYPGKGPPTKQ
jgi:hypothetical protein